MLVLWGLQLDHGHPMISILRSMICHATNPTIHQLFILTFYCYLLLLKIPTWISEYFNKLYVLAKDLYFFFKTSLWWFSSISKAIRISSDGKRYDFWFNILQNQNKKASNFLIERQPRKFLKNPFFCFFNHVKDFQTLNFI